MTMIAIGFCLAGRMNPLLAAILMPASSLVSLAIVFIGMRGFALRHASGVWKRDHSGTGKLSRLSAANS